MKTSIILTLATALLGGAGALLADEKRRTIGDGDMPRMLREYDLNGDGVLSHEERQAMDEARRTRREGDRNHDQWDANKDGVISAAELAAAHEALRARIEERRGERFDAADGDASGGLSRAEWNAIPAIARLIERHPERAAAIFNRLDANHDESISREEFLAHLQQRRDGPPRGGGGGRKPPRRR